MKKSWVLAVVLLSLVASDALAQFGQSIGTPPQVPEALAEAIVRAGYRRVGVLPQFVCRRSSDSGLAVGSSPAESLSGDYATHAALFAEKVEEALVENAYGRYQVVSNLLMRRAFKDIVLDDLQDLEKLKSISAKVDGLDALVIGYVQPTDMIATSQSSGGPALELRCSLLELETGAAGRASRVTMPLSIGGEVYAGKSFELRRWMGDELVNLGLYEFAGRSVFRDSDFNPALGVGPTQLKGSGCPHPLEDPSCPFYVSVEADGKPCELVWVRRQAYGDPEPYVVMDYGQTYILRIRNRCPVDTCCAFFVDGVNILGKRREHPGKCRHWRLPKLKDTTKEGWYTRKNDKGDYDVEEFVVGQPGDSVAGRQGFFDSLGLITAVFYTEGVPVTQNPWIRRGSRGGLGNTTWEYDRQQKRWISQAREPEQPPPSRPQRGGRWPLLQERLNQLRYGNGPQPTGVGPANMGPVGTAAGQSRTVHVNEVEGDKPGLILTAITIHYTTPSRLEELQKEANVGPR